MDTLSPKITLFGKTMNIKEFLTLLYTEAKTSGYDSNTGNVWCLAYQRNVSAPGIPMDQLTEEQRLYVYATTFLSFLSIRFLYKGIIIKHNKTEPTYTKTSLFLCEKRRFFMARTEKGVVATI